jgi:hypothetical protein
MVCRRGFLITWRLEKLFRGFRVVSVLQGLLSTLRNTTKACNWANFIFVSR